MAAIRAAVVIGLARCRSAPTANAACTCEGMASAVSETIGVRAPPVCRLDQLCVPMGWPLTVALTSEPPRVPSFSGWITTTA